MKKIVKNADGTVTVTLDVVDLNAIGAAIWLAKEGSLNNSDGHGLYSRFYPDGEAPTKVTPLAFENRVWKIYAQLRRLGVDMG